MLPFLFKPALHVHTISNYLTFIPSFASVSRKTIIFLLSFSGSHSNRQKWMNLLYLNFVPESRNTVGLLMLLPNGFRRNTYV